jgi:outer membrane protein W
VLGKHYFARRNSTVRPFASAGYTVRKVWVDSDRVRASLFDRASELEQGPVLGAGAGIKAWRLTFAPEVRYTRWTDTNLFSTNRNQLQAVFGILF